MLGCFRMNSYPILVQLEGRTVVIIGGGRVAARKVNDLLDCGARVTIISPEATGALAALAAGGAIDWRKAPYSDGILAKLKPVLVFAATDSPAVNQAAAAEAAALGILVNTADAQTTGSFSSMAAVRRGNVRIAVSTDGASPALTAHLRQEIESVIGAEYGTLAGWLAAIRPEVQQAIPTQEERRALWHTILDSPVLDHLRRGDEETAKLVFNNILQENGIRRGMARHAPICVIGKHSE